MFQNREGETEILLGNKQIVGIFFALAVLFGVFFTAGYMVGRNSGEKNIEDKQIQANAAASPAAAGQLGETHAVPGDAGAGAEAVPTEGSSAEGGGSQMAEAPEAPPAARTETAAPKKTINQPIEEAGSDSLLITPRRGQTYLQVTAVSRSEAEAVAGVLSKKGFRAHFAAGPNAKLFRVLVGPVRDAGELSTTRDELRHKGFRQVFVQRYQ
jgi:cell division septation protein DedD